MWCSQTLSGGSGLGWIRKSVWDVTLEVSFRHGSGDFELAVECKSGVHERGVRHMHLVILVYRLCLNPQNGYSHRGCEFEERGGLALSFNHGASVRRGWG